MQTVANKYDKINWYRDVIHSQKFYPGQSVIKVVDGEILVAIDDLEEDSHWYFTGKHGEGVTVPMSFVVNITSGELVEEPFNNVIFDMYNCVFDHCGFVEDYLPFFIEEFRDHYGNTHEELMINLAIEKITGEYY